MPGLGVGLEPVRRLEDCAAQLARERARLALVDSLHVDVEREAAAVALAALFAPDCALVLLHVVAELVGAEDDVAAPGADDLLADALAEVQLLDVVGEVAPERKGDAAVVAAPDAVELAAVQEGLVVVHLPVDRVGRFKTKINIK